MSSSRKAIPASEERISGFVTMFSSADLTLGALPLKSERLMTASTLNSVTTMATSIATGERSEPGTSAPAMGRPMMT